ncbi:DNA methylase [candidate division KSB1 bacterium]|nr:DNA methylase [candidate division KSB1 bacterium]
MAESPAHQFGQLIGELLESVVRPQLEDFCQNQGLYLDHQKRERPARSGKKISWTDHYGNAHDLDFVIERDGTDDQIGRPVAFIESAWRRYTKHSRNKAQEIQGAILPLADKYRWNNPFLGVVLAGAFTEGSINQLRSLGFHVLYFPYESLVAAFQSEGIDIAFDESTPDRVFRRTTNRIKRVSPGQMDSVRTYLVGANQTAIDDFFRSLRQRLGRHVTRVVVIPLYGRVNEFSSIEAAIYFLDGHLIYEGSGEFRKYEIRIEFSNGDKVDAFIESNNKVKEFLEFVARQ